MNKETIIIIENSKAVKKEQIYRLHSLISIHGFKVLCIFVMRLTCLWNLVTAMAVTTSIVGMCSIEKYNVFDSRLKATHTY